VIDSAADDIPISVETLSRPYFPMVRCNYLYLECDAPRPGWTLGINSGRLPFLMLGLMGIVQAPFDAPRFTEYRHLDELFARVEENGFQVHFADIWLPDFVFGPREPHVGDVYRVDVRVFKMAQLFRDGGVTQEHFLDFLRDSTDQIGVRFSEEETRVFLAWTVENLSAAAIQPDKDPELKLGTRETS
jgi:hypothetical protein